MNANINVGISGEYKFVITNTETGEETETEWIPNLLTDYGLAAIHLGTSTNTWGQYCSIGTGNTAPAFTDSQLDNRTSTVIYSSNWVGTLGSAPDYNISYTSIYVFPQGASAGETIREVGIGRLDTGLDLVSRALVLDGNGDPSEFTLTAIDRLTVYYKLNLQMPILTTGSFDLNGTTIYYSGTPCRLQYIASQSFFITSGIQRFFSTQNSISGYSYANLYPITTAPPEPLNSIPSNALSSVTSSEGIASYSRTTTSMTNSITVLDVYGNAEIGAIGVCNFSQSILGFFKFYSDAGFTTPYAITKLSTQTLSFSYTWTLSRA